MNSRWGKHFLGVMTHSSLEDAYLTRDKGNDFYIFSDVSIKKMQICQNVKNYSI